MSDTLPILLNLVAAATGSSRELDARIEVAMRWIEAGRIGMREDMRAPWKARADGIVWDPWTNYRSAAVTASQDEAVRLIERMLPGWWWRCGTCHVSDDACIAPDLNSPEHGKRLRKELGSIASGSEFDAGFDVDRRPPGNVPLALLEALLQVLIAVTERTRPTAPHADRADARVTE